MPSIDPLAIHNHLRRTYLRMTHGGTRSNDVNTRGDITTIFTQYLSNLKADGTIAGYDVTCNSINNPGGTYPTAAAVRIELAPDLGWHIKFPAETVGI